uniref:Uncharacterized protein n=1 Tax=Lygus hesperus TaxID=30085 RepID=A0A0K8TE33_LYGHE
MLFRVGVLIVLGMVMISSEGRSIDQAAALNFPNQGNYHDYAEQQDYPEQQGEVDRSARDVQETGYQPQKEFVREESNSNVAGAAYQARVNGDDDDLEQQPPNNAQVGLDGRAMDERGMKKEDDAVDSDVAEQREIAEQQEVAEQRDAADQRDVAESRDIGEQRDVAEQREDSLRQNSNVDPVEVGRGGDAANFRPPRDNGAIQALQEAARTEMARGDAGEVGFEEPHDQAAGRPINEA